MQKVNQTVFKNPIKIMKNIEVYTSIAQKTIDNYEIYNNWIVPNMHYSEQNKLYYIDKSDNLWRLYDYIDGTVYNKPISLICVRELGIALAKMHFLLKSLSPSQIDLFSIHFHNISYYYNMYKNICNNKIYNEYELYCEKIINENCLHMIEYFNNLENLTKQVIHGDPKIGNMVFDKKNNSVIAFIDLDTLCYAPLLIDICDCLRSITNMAGDVPIDYSMVKFNITNLKIFLESYKRTELIYLNDYDINAIYFFLQLMPFELGLRFFIDHITGNQYFPVKNKTDNLYRAICQFKLFEDILRNDVESIIKSIFRK